MNQGYTVIDNFLPETDFISLKEIILGENFPWYYNDVKVSLEDSGDFDFQFFHIFYKNFSSNSPYFKMLEPLINNLQPDSLIRIKANMTTKTEKLYKYSFHRDFEIKCLTAVYYINTNNGYTEFQNGDRVQSVENRICIFDSKMLHRGTTCTDEKKRCLININYTKEWIP